MSGFSTVFNHIFRTFGKNGKNLIIMGVAISVS